MEAAFRRLRNTGADALGARPTIVDSIMVNGEQAHIAIPQIHTLELILIANVGSFFRIPGLVHALGTGTLQG